MAPVDLNSTPDAEVEDSVELKSDNLNSQFLNPTFSGHVRINDRIRVDTLCNNTMSQMFWSFSFIRLFYYIFASEIETLRILKKKRRSFSSRIFGNGNQRIRRLVYAFISFFIFITVSFIQAGNTIHTKDCTTSCAVMIFENFTLTYNQEEMCAVNNTCAMICKTGESAGATFVFETLKFVFFLLSAGFGVYSLYRKSTLDSTTNHLQPIDFKNIPISRARMPRTPKHYQNDFSIIMTFFFSVIFLLLTALYAANSIFVMFDFKVNEDRATLFVKYVCLTNISLCIGLICSGWSFFSNEVLDKKYNDKFAKFNVKLYAYLKHHNYGIQKLNIHTSSQTNAKPTPLILITQNTDTSKPLLVYSFSY